MRVGFLSAHAKPYYAGFVLNQLAYTLAAIVPLCGEFTNAEVPFKSGVGHAISNLLFLITREIGATVTTGACPDPHSVTDALFDSRYHHRYLGYGCLFRQYVEL
jgi:hypothetical protein